MRIPFHLSFLLNVTKANHFQDIVIVDTQKDLNVFKDMFQGQKEDGPPLGCCTPEPSSCCGTSKREENSGGELRMSDFNEWAGKFTASRSYSIGAAVH